MTTNILGILQPPRGLGKVLRRSISAWVKVDDWINATLNSDDSSAAKLSSKIVGQEQTSYTLLILPDTVDLDASLLWRFARESDAAHSQPLALLLRPDAMVRDETIPQDTPTVDALFARESSSSWQDGEKNTAQALDFSEGDLLLAKRHESSTHCECLRVADMSCGLAPWSHLVFCDEGDSDFGSAEDVAARSMYMTPDDLAALEGLKPILVHRFSPKSTVGELLKPIRNALEAYALALQESTDGVAPDGASKRVNEKEGPRLFDVSISMAGDSLSDSTVVDDGLIGSGFPVEICIADFNSNDDTTHQGRQEVSHIRLPINGGLQLQHYSLDTHPRREEVLSVLSGATADDGGGWFRWFGR